MLISRWQIPLLILMLLTSCSAQSTYYVTPTPDTPCPEEPCHTLSEYVAGQYFKNLPMNTTMEFLPGNHTLEQTISVINLPHLALCGASASLPEVTSRIQCTWPAGFIFTGITKLHISALAFTSCSHDGRAAVSIISVSQSIVSNCIFQNNANTNSSECDYGYGLVQGYVSDCNGGALYIQNSYIILTVSKFQNNSAVHGSAVYMDISNSIITGNTFEYNYAGKGGPLSVDESILSLMEDTFQKLLRGALYVKSSRINLTGNTFQYNSAYRNGGALSAWSSTLNLAGNTFQNNTVSEDGGAFAVYESTLNLSGNKF